MSTAKTSIIILQTVFGSVGPLRLLRLELCKIGYGLNIPQSSNSSSHISYSRVQNRTPLKQRRVGQKAYLMGYEGLEHSMEIYMVQ